MYSDSITYFFGESRLSGVERLRRFLKFSLFMIHEVGRMLMSSSLLICLGIWVH